MFQMSQLTRCQAIWGRHPLSHPGAAVIQASGGRFSQDQRESSREKPLISDLSLNLLVKKWSHLHLLLYSSKISTMTMNLTPKASLGMARYPPQGLAGEGLQGFS